MNVSNMTIKQQTHLIIWLGEEFDMFVYIINVKMLEIFKAKLFSGQLGTIFGSILFNIKTM